MKRFLAILTAILCLASGAFATEAATLPAPTPAPVPQAEMTAEPEKAQTLITTVGVEDATAPIDIAVLSFAMKAQAETVAEANQLVTANISTIEEILAAQGVTEENIWHRQYDVSADVVYHNTKLTEDQVIAGYIVEITLCVRLTDISLVGVVIDAATQSGASKTHELVFERSTANEVYEAAMAEAAQQAVEKAQSLAASLNMELGDMVSMKELSQVKDGEARVEVTFCAR